MIGDTHATIQTVLPTTSEYYQTEKEATIKFKAELEQIKLLKNEKKKEIYSLRPLRVHNNVNSIKKNWTEQTMKKENTPSSFKVYVVSLFIYVHAFRFDKSKWTGQDDNKNDCTYINIRLGIGKFLSNSRSSNLTRLKIKQKTKQQPRTRAISNDNGNTEQVLIMSKTNRNNEQWMERERKKRVNFGVLNHEIDWASFIPFCCTSTNWFSVFRKCFGPIMRIKNQRMWNETGFSVWMCCIATCRAVQVMYFIPLWYRILAHDVF